MQESVKEIDESDEALLMSWREERNEGAIRTLCERHAALVLAACRRQAAPYPDDAAQAVFIILAEKPQAIGDPRRLIGWLLGVTRRVVTQQRRAIRKRHHHEQLAAKEQARQHVPPQEESWHDVLPILDDALAKLSPGRREALVRYYLEGKPQAQVATELGCSVDAVKTRVHEGLSKLRTLLSRRGVSLSIATLATCLAGQAAAAESACAVACCRAALLPSSSQNALTLAQGVYKTMFITSASLGACASLFAGAALLIFMSGAEGEPLPTPSSTPIAALVAENAAAVAEANPADNAALDWWRASMFIPSDTDPIWQKWKEVEAGKRISLTMEESERLSRPLRLLELGSQNSYCAWGIDIQEGPEALMQPFVAFRKLIHLGLLRIQAHRPGQAGQPVDDILTCLRASRIASGIAPTSIDFLFYLRCEEQVLRMTAQLAPELNPEERKRMLDGIAGLPVPTKLSACLAGELKLALHQLNAFRTQPEDGRIASAEMEMFSMTETFNAEDPDLDVMVTDASLNQALLYYPKEFSRVEEHWKLPFKLRQVPLNPAPGSMEGSSSPWIQLNWQGLKGLPIQEARLVVARELLAAALTYLDQGDAGLATHPDPLTGKPFQLIEKEGKRGLTAQIFDDHEPIIFWLGPKNHQ